MDETTKAAMESARPLTIFNIQEVHQLNPNATQVVNHYYGDQFVPKDLVRTLQPESEPENATRNPQLCKDSILEYVMKLHPFLVREEWRDKYKELWEEILELPEVMVPKKKGENNDIYDKGNLKNTTFNRDLVAKILNLMAERKVLATTCAKRLYEALEGDKNRSVYNVLAYLPTKEVVLAVDGLIKKIKKSLLDVHQ